MRIRSSFILLILLIGIVVVGVTGTTINQAYQDRQSAIAARELSSIQGELMRTIERIGTERGADNGALVAERPTDPKADNVAKPRQATDAAFDAALALARAMPHRAVDLARIEAARSMLQDWRRRVDTAIVQPQASRPADIVRGYSPAIVEMLAKLTPVLNAIDAATASADSDVAAPMTIARLAADMRAAASARHTLLVNVIASGKPIAPTVSSQFSDYSGRIDTLWDRITMVMTMIDASPALKEAVSKTEQGYFVSGLPPVYADVRAGSDKGGVWPYTANEFRAQHNPKLFVAGDLRDAAVAEAIRVANVVIAERTGALVAQGTVAGVALLLLIGGTVFFLLRVVSPLGAMTGTMTRIARGEEAEIGYGERRDEVGDMARALGIFQRNAEEKAKLEADERGRAETERSRMAEQRSREEAISREIAQFCAAVSEGDFSRRIDLASKEGVFRDLSQQLNGLADTVQNVMDDLSAVLGALAHGDLSRNAAGQYKGAFAVLAQAARDSVLRLRDFAGRLAESARLVRDASGEISSGSLDLAQRTEAQAASIEETAASMHEITATVKQNADNAQAANQLAAVARDTAEKGGAVVGEAVSAVSRIEQSAQKISDIVSLIDEIAFQTNLLALNASVEAARAGEAGKGFAVVAQEVRALAQRSANASKDIKALISESNIQVKTGADLVGRTGSSLTDIVTSVKKVSDIVAEIAAASREQATGLEQINTAVGSMDEMTQRNGALVEETSASAQALADQGRQLADLVGFFKLGDAVPAAPIAVALPADRRPTAVPATKPAARKAVPPVAKTAAKPKVVAPAAMRPAAGDDWQEF